MVASPLFASPVGAEPPPPAPPVLLASRRAADCCVVVADGGSARIFSTKPAARSGTRFVQYAAVSAADTPERDRDFADAVVAQVRNFVSIKGSGKVLLVAPPRALGLLREPLQRALGARIVVMALARDYSGLTPEELVEVIHLS